MSLVGRLKVRIKKTFVSSYNYFVRLKPWKIVALIVVLTLLIALIFEFATVALFNKKATDYTNSTQLQLLKNKSTRFQQVSETQGTPMFCQISIDKFIETFNLAYSKENVEEIIALQNEIRQSIAQLPRPPSYAQKIRLLPYFNEAKTNDNQLENAWTQLREIDFQTAYSLYCAQMNDALSHVYFVSTLKQPDGFDALLPGQRDNFRINTDQAKQKAQNLPYPLELEREHIRINELLVDIGNVLSKKDLSDKELTDEMSRIYAELNEVLELLEQKTTKLQSVADKLTLLTTSLTEMSR